jgi:hypothetical protein
LQNQSLVESNAQIERNIKIANAAKEFILERKNKEHSEMLKLIEITAKAIQLQLSKNYKVDYLKTKIQQALDTDIQKTIDINKKLVVGDPYPFRFNKLLDLFTQSKKFIDLKWNLIQNGNVDELLYKPNGYSWEGTSILNYMQTSMLEILSVIYETPISDLKCLKEAGNIYQMSTSPNIQSTRVFNLPNVNYSMFKDINSQNINQKYEIMQGWRWSLEEHDVEHFDFKEKKAFKLVVPSLGFAFGGTRYDKEYSEKKFRLHDCSSLVGDFLGLNTFSTHFLKALYDKEFELNLTTQQKDIDVLDRVKMVLKYKGDNGVPEAGNVFLISSLCGFVLEVNDEKNELQVLDSTRYMPYVEGIIKENYMRDEDDHRKWFRQLNSFNVDDFMIYIGKTNENSTIPPNKPSIMYFFEVIG